MISVGELRIGNILLHEKEMIAVAVIARDNILLEYLNGNCTVIADRNSGFLNHDDVKPVPLTPERLKKFQFEHMEFPLDNEVGYARKSDRYFVGFTYANGDWLLHSPFFNKSIKFVHELQNLYFALTGEELTIKERV